MNGSRRSLVVGLVVAWAAGCGPAAEPRQRVELHIESDGDDMAFKPHRLRCPSGASVRLYFHHTGEILHDPHDWVLLKPGTKLAFLADALTQPEGGRNLNQAMVIAATPMCGKGQRVSVDFIAPAPGDYPFVCSVPGHGDTMQGTLTVTA